MRVSLKTLVAISAVICLSGCQATPSEWMFGVTGEEDLLAQLRGVGQLMANVLHRSPRQALYEPVSHAGVNPFGINVFLHHEVEPQKRERSLEMIADAGFHWIRQEFPWEDIEIHGKDDFVDRRNDPDGVDAWAKYDNIVDLADEHGLEITVRLSNPPAWTRSLTNTVGTYAPPDDLADWGDFVAAVVSRYKGRIGHYQLWNEPNIYPEWGERPVDPEGYTDLLCEGYRRAKEADPDAVIISGALAPTVSLHPGPGPGLGVNDFVFLQRMYDAGAAACFDVMAVNDYMLWSGPTDRRMQPDNINFARPIYIRDIMVANGDAGKPIWISEMNSNAVPDEPGIQGWGAYGQVTPEQQARYAVLAYQRVMQEWPWAGVVNFWFFKRATDVEKDQSWYYFRMVEPDFTPLPVYDAVKEYAPSVTPALYPGNHQETHWALAYSGEWEEVGHGQSAPEAYSRAAAPGASVSFEYDGASVTLVPGPGAGEAEVRIDDGTPRRMACDGQPVVLASALTADRHKVTLTSVSGSVTVDSLLVKATPRYWLWGFVGVLAAAGIACGLHFARQRG
jgi:hypothetical protein